MDNLTSEVVGWFEFENTYGMDRVVAGVGKVIGRLERGDFALAQQQVMNDYTLEDLQRM